jgi:hypothetical protein
MAKKVAKTVAKKASKKAATKNATKTTVAKKALKETAATKASTKKVAKKDVKDVEKSHDIYGTGVRVQFGKGGKLADWRKAKDVDFDPDDEDLPCPPEVKAILGFDPDEE